MIYLFGLVVASAQTRPLPAEQETFASNFSWPHYQKPFRIYDNTWHVGPHGLGVNLHDIKWILNTHAHSDHAGGMAQLAHYTDAQVIAGAADTPLLERGGHDDPEYGDRFPLPPAHVARTVADGNRLHLGDLVLHGTRNAKSYQGQHDLDVDIMRGQALPAYGGCRQPVGARSQIDREPELPRHHQGFRAWLCDNRNIALRHPSRSPSGDG